MSCGSAPAWLPFGGVQGGCAIETGAAEVRSSMVMDELHARVSKGGRVLCGRLDADGHYTCDEPLAGFAVPDATRPHVRYLIALDGWALDRKKAIWHRTTSVEDRAAACQLNPM